MRYWLCLLVILSTGSWFFFTAPVCCEELSRVLSDPILFSQYTEIASRWLLEKDPQAFSALLQLALACLDVDFLEYSLELWVQETTLRKEQAASSLECLIYEIMLERVAVDFPQILNYESAALLSADDASDTDVDIPEDNDMQAAWFIVLLVGICGVLLICGSWSSW